MVESDENELARYKAYDEFKGHFERYLTDHGARSEHVTQIVRSIIWWSSVMAKVDGWLRWLVAASMIAAITALIGTLTLKDALAGLGIGR